LPWLQSCRKPDGTEKKARPLLTICDGKTLV
jgi:hypothetical protein